LRKRKIRDTRFAFPMPTEPQTIDKVSFNRAKTDETQIYWLYLQSSKFGGADLTFSEQLDSLSDVEFAAVCDVGGG
jgi:hypothetical protein